MMANSDAPEPPDLDRYRAIEYRSENGLVTIIQDTENEAAWVQSDVREEVRR
ncbi:hypothetical protein EGH21_14440 [Halomicroarcula sp. F13]|uniref:Uncharacterized protein n=1 Tax=Haloarcula rubra TaxID=2487747 RepID=A0AAW4PUC6_9EURY|nr:hypothetical protein [Halomicroarcula rubra]MBX0324234.1 hypothetical protein [Halomicroarcula rubra]